MRKDKERSENSYRSILKGTSIFGGVQVFQILINIVRGKFVAMFLGPEGMGISSMFSSSANTIGGMATLGLNAAFVKEVAANKKDPGSLAQVMRVATVLIYVTSLLGAVICAVMAPWLSQWSFGTTDYAWQYLLLSVSVCLTVASQGKSALLQGLHRVKLLSMTALAGAVSGLLTGVPLYYFFGNKGIVPAMIILSVTTFIFNTIGLRRALPHRPVRFVWQSHKPLVKRLITLGIILLSSSLFFNLCTYGINIFVRTFGDMTDVGLFNAANSITVQYMGVVFTAMALDYFPRLSAAGDDRPQMRLIINRQMTIVALLATPLSIGLVVTAPLIIELLLTREFLSVTPLMKWLGLSILLKAIAYPLGYIALTKDNKKLFFWLESVVCNVLYLGLSLVFYYFFGLIGLGYAAVTEQAVCIVIYLAVNFKIYGFYPDAKAVTETLLALLFGTAAFCASFATNAALSYYLMASVLLICAVRSFIILRRLSLR